MRYGPLLLVLASVAGTVLTTGTASGQEPPKTLRFGGYEWIVRGAGKGGPGPNQWSSDNVWLDSSGQLHLKIRRVRVPASATAPARDDWQCAELYTREKMGYGIYTFEILGPIDRFDPNIVLGLFDYPGKGDGPDGTNEIDIEIAHWGNARYPNGNFTIYPDSGPRDTHASHTFPFQLKDSGPQSLTTHTFVRKPDGIELASFAGNEKTGTPLARWHYSAPTPLSIPQKRLPVHINLWLFAGHPPTDGKEVEIIVRSFLFKPAP